MAAAGPVVRILEKHPGCSLRLTPTAPFERYRPSTTLRCGARRSGGRTCCLPSLAAAATLPKWGFPHGNGICCNLVVQPVCIGSETAWQVGPLNTFASTGLLLNRCCGRENGTAKQKVSS
jgi:hypothetical protein